MLATWPGMSFVAESTCTCGCVGAAMADCPIIMMPPAITVVIAILTIFLYVAFIALLLT